METCSGGGRETGGVFRGGDVDLLRDGSHKICLGLLHTCKLGQSIACVKRRWFIFKQITGIINDFVSRCFSSRHQRNILVTWFSLLSPLSSLDSVSLSSSSGLSINSLPIPLHQHFRPFLLFHRRSRRLDKVRPRTWTGEEDGKRSRTWTHQDEVDREMGSELTQPLSVPTWL